MKFLNRTSIFPFSRDLQDLEFFRLMILFDFLLFLPIFVMIPLNVAAYCMQLWFKTLENQFFFTYGILRSFLYLMIFFIIMSQYISLLYELVMDISGEPKIGKFFSFSFQLLIFLIFNFWTFYLALNYYQLIEKHIKLYDFNEIY